MTSPALLAPLDDPSPHAPAPSAPTASPLLRLRCLDLSHSPLCTTCTPPPTIDDEKLFQLQLFSTTTNGEQRLRSLIGATPEWKSSEARLVLAARLDAEGQHPALAAVLRERELPQLRKGTLLQLCRSWGYRCDVWARKGAKRNRPPASTSLVAAGGHQHRPPSRLDAPPFSISLDSLRHLLDTCLRPAARQAAAHWRGPVAESASRDPLQFAHIRDSFDMEERCLDAAKVLTIVDVLRAGVGAQADAGTTTLSDAGGDEPPQPHRRGHLFDGPCEASIRSLHAVFTAGAAQLASHLKEKRMWPGETRCLFFPMYLLLTRSPLFPPVLSLESQAALDESLSLVAHTHAASAPFCVASQAEYLEASALTLAFMAEFLSLFRAAFGHRHAWMAELFVPSAAPSALPAPAVLAPRLPLVSIEMSFSRLAFLAEPGAGAGAATVTAFGGSPSDKEIESALLRGPRPDAPLE